MIGYKTIEEFTLKECKAFLKREDISEDERRKVEKRKNWLLSHMPPPPPPQPEPRPKTILEKFPEYKFRPVSMISSAKFNPSNWLIPIGLIPIYFPLLVLGIRAKKHGHALKDIADYISMSTKYGRRGARAIFVKDRKFGVLNSYTNEIIVSAEFDKLRWESRQVLIASVNGKSILLNIKGYRSKEYDSLSWRERGEILVAKTGNEQRLIDIYGNELT